MALLRQSKTASCEPVESLPGEPPALASAMKCPKCAAAIAENTIVCPSCRAVLRLRAALIRAGLLSLIVIVVYQLLI